MSAGQPLSGRMPGYCFLPLLVALDKLCTERGGLAVGIEWQCGNHLTVEDEVKHRVLADPERARHNTTAISSIAPRSATANKMASGGVSLGSGA